MEKKMVLFSIAMIAFITMTAAAGPFGEGPEMSVYPNPATDQVKINIEAESTLVPEVRILDLTGKVILEFENPFTLSNEHFRADLDVSDLQNGIYFVKLTQGKEVYTKKLIVK